METNSGENENLRHSAMDTAASSNRNLETGQSAQAEAKSTLLHEDGIRAPDPSKRQRLVADEFDSSYRNMINHFGATVGAAEQLQDPFRDFRAEAAALASTDFAKDSMDQSSGLAGIFQPPIKILFRGNFSEARQTAKEQKKWLLVNLQSTTEFVSHILNRDTWSDDVLQNFIASSFIFWQNYASCEEGRLYSERYQVDLNQLPHIAIIDPRTGGKIIEWAGFLDARDLLEKLSDFREHNSLDIFQPQRKATNRNKNTKISASELSENKQLEAAIAASLETEREAIAIEDDSDDSMDIPADTKPLFPLSEEPADEAGTTRVQIRTADGQRIVRRFHKTEPIGALFTLVRSQVPNATLTKFQLTTSFPSKQVEEISTSIADAGLENASLNMMWIT